MRAVLFTLLAAACSAVSVEGKVVDGMTGAVVPGPIKLTAKAASAEASLSCQVFQTEVGADGTFKFPSLCAGTAYRLDLDREDLWAADFTEIPDGGTGAPIDLAVWPAPKGAGIYRMSGGTFEPLKTAADLRKEKAWKSDVVVNYPATIPDSVVLVGAEDHLVMVGKSTIEELKFRTVIPSGTRQFGDDAWKITMEPWSYIGLEFKSDTEFREVPATLDASKTVDKERGNRQVRWISGTAMSPGRYAIYKDGDKRTYLVDFVSPPAAAPVAAPAGG